MGELTFEVLIKDEDYRKLGSWKFKKNDCLRYFNIMNYKYNLGLTIKENKKMNDKDLSWAI